MIIYNGKNSLKDFDLYVASKELPPATRKEITETVPYMSGQWDFSFIDGNDEYEPVILKYSFDVIASTKQELFAQRTAIIQWLHSRGDQKLYDSDISLEEYYEVYSAKAGWSEDGLQGLITVEFTCYPFRKSEYYTLKLNIPADGLTLNISNEGYRPIMPIITLTAAANISDGVNKYSLGAGTYNKIIWLKKGNNQFTITGTGEITFKHWKEVL